VPRSSAKRAAILNAANRLQRQGDPFSVDALLREAGAGVGTFYHHFPGGVEDVMEALRAAAAAGYEAALQRVLQRNRDAETGVKALVHHHVRWCAENPEAARLLPERPTSDLVRIARAWARAVGLERVSGEELIAVSLVPLRVASNPERMAGAAWAAVMALEG